MGGQDWGRFSPSQDETLTPSMPSVAASSTLMFSLPKPLATAISQAGRRVNAGVDDGGIVLVFLRSNGGSATTDLRRCPCIYACARPAGWPPQNRHLRYADHALLANTTDMPVSDRWQRSVAAMVMSLMRRVLRPVARARLMALSMAWSSSRCSSASKQIGNGRGNLSGLDASHKCLPSYIFKMGC